MKKFFTLSVMLLFTGLLFAERPSAKLTISNNSKSRVTVSVDGQNYIAERGAQNGIDIFISDLRAGYHSVKIYQQDNWGGWWGDRNMNKMIYNENLLLKPQCRTDIIIGKHNKVSINEQLTGWGNGNNDGNWDKDDNRGGWHHNGQWNNGSRDNNYRQPMDGRSFDQLKYLINRTYSDNDKLNVAKQAISLNYFNAWQIKEMMQLLNFEGNKLDLAKYGYAYTLDRQNYYQVNDALGYNSSRVELARFIQQQQR
ncbi:MAG: DUF4476 domain-containing protein [Bacteroidetes bacterium]|nr:DUF4476 domain-containing protein [Bacteroidota bacterium]